MGWMAQYEARKRWKESEWNEAKKKWNETNRSISPPVPVAMRRTTLTDAKIKSDKVDGAKTRKKNTGK